MTVAPTPAAGVGLADLLRDTRHMTARAAPDLADWLVRLEQLPDLPGVHMPTLRAVAAERIAYAVIEGRA